jgi:hypothetical protein
VEQFAVLRQGLKGVEGREEGCRLQARPISGLSFAGRESGSGELDPENPRKEEGFLAPRMSHPLGQDGKMEKRAQTFRHLAPSDLPPPILATASGDCG